MPADRLPHSPGAPAEKMGGEVAEACCVIEMPDLKGRDKLDGAGLFILVEKEGA